MTIQNRTVFLNKIAEELGRPRKRSKVQRPSWSVQPQEEVYKNLSQEELISKLEEQCAVIHTNFKRTDRSGLASLLTETIQDHHGRKILISQDERNEIYKLNELYKEWEASGIEVKNCAQEDQEALINYAEQADIGITFTEMTLAESGTVVLYNDKNNSRSVSLLPRVHIVIIPKETIQARLTQAMQEIHQMEKRGETIPSCISLISGPSNSADIEMNLIVGVHGPVEVTYILVD